MACIRSLRRTRVQPGKNEGQQYVNNKQQVQHTRGIFGCIRRDQLSRVLEMIEEDPLLLQERDAAGATPIHIAFLYKKYVIAKALIEHHPEMATLPYGEGSYKGENILHIAITHKEISLVRWLLQNIPPRLLPTLLGSEATGEFFKPGGNLYFGGYPLLFAVAANQVTMVQAILDVHLDDALNVLQRSPSELQLSKSHVGYNSILLSDSQGNTALHMCVIHDLPGMFEFIYEKALAKEKASLRSTFVPSLAYMLNDQGLTPLALAAALGRRRMFEHILTKTSVVRWQYGPVTCIALPLQSLDYRRDAEDGSHEVLAMECLRSRSITNCLQPRYVTDVLKKRQEIVMLDPIRQLLDKKWHCFGRRTFIFRLATAMVVQMLWLVSTVIPNHYRLNDTNFADYPYHNGAIIACEACVLLYAAVRLLQQLAGVVRHGPRHILRNNGAASVDNVLGLLFSLSYITSWGLRAGYLITDRDQTILCVEEVFLAIAAIASWCYMFFFLLGFRSTGPFIIMVKEMVWNDMRRFFGVYLSVLMGFTMALYLVMDADDDPSIVQFLLHMRRLVLLSFVGDLNMDYYDADPNSWFTNVLLIIYILMVTILLLNLLIAMLGNTYSTVDKEAERRWYLERANLLAAFEGDCGPQQLSSYRRQYGVQLDVGADEDPGSSSDDEDDTGGAGPPSSDKYPFYLLIEQADDAWDGQLVEGASDQSPTSTTGELPPLLDPLPLKDPTMDPSSRMGEAVPLIGANQNEFEGWEVDKSASGGVHRLHQDTTMVASVTNAVREVSV